jgi:hypothetical protein
LDHIDLILESLGKPYVHCWGGNGRTGTVIGCWLVRHGRTPDQALKEMEHGRAGRGFTRHAPENDRQRRFIIDWPSMDPALSKRRESHAQSTADSAAANARALKQPKNWFEKLTGVIESSPEAVRQHIRIEGDVMHSAANGQRFHPGKLEVPTLAELRKRVHALGTGSGSIRYGQQVADAQSLHVDPANANALFQVASQFNLLEMVSPDVTPEQGIGRYENDRTQGPACAVACGAGTIFRNYFGAVDGGIGQTADRQIDCLSEIAKALGNGNGTLWQMRNGYALPSPDGLHRVNEQLSTASDAELDELHGLLRIGLHWQTQVTIDGGQNRVSQAYCSAMPLSYSGLPAKQWEPFARLILEAAYEATLCSAILNAHESDCNRLFLTSLGGGAFGNPHQWITDAIERALDLHRNQDLDVYLVSYGRPIS